MKAPKDVNQSDFGGLPGTNVVSNFGTIAAPNIPTVSDMGGVAAQGKQEVLKEQYKKGTRPGVPVDRSTKEKAEGNLAEVTEDINKAGGKVRQNGGFTQSKVDKKNEDPNLHETAYGISLLGHAEQKAKNYVEKLQENIPVPVREGAQFGNANRHGFNINGSAEERNPGVPGDPPPKQK
jgi:hypothetical protein